MAGRTERERLIVEHCGDERVVARGDTLTFGRSADVVIDANPYLHRILGRFRHDGRSWWLDNVGRSSALTLLSVDDLSSATVGPGSTAPILQIESVVAFGAGPAEYEVAVTNERAERQADLGPVAADGPLVTNERAERQADLGPVAADGPLVTLEWGRIDLNPDQVEMLRVLCEHRLARPSDQWADIPSNRACAARLGWTLAKYNRKLDHVCDRLARSGVRGLRGDLGLSAVDRRRVLVDHVVQSGLLTRAASVGELSAGGSGPALSAPAAPRPRRRG